MKQDEKQDVKERLLVSGLKVFANKGFEGATVREICDDARSNIAGINYYFGDKRGFYAAVREYARSIRSAVMEKCWKALETDPWKALELHVEIMLDYTYDETMFDINWLFLRELIDDNGDESSSHPRSPSDEERRKTYEERMTRLLTSLLGEEAATPANISLLRYTYHSLCRFLPIQSKIEKRQLKGKGVFDVRKSYGKKELSDYIVAIVKRAVEEIRGRQ